MSTPLFTDLLVRFKALTEKDSDRLQTNTLTSEPGVVDCSSINLLGDRDSEGVARLEKKGIYDVPLIKSGSFTEAQLLVAFVDVFLTYFWIENSWISNVGRYDTTMPQSVTMC